MATADRQAAAGQARQTLDNRGFERSFGDNARGSYDPNRYRSSFDAGMRGDLDRSYNARTNGYRNYNNRQSHYGAGRQYGNRQFRRRR